MNATFEPKLSALELSEIFGVSVMTIHRWVTKRGLPHYRTLGRKLRFSPRELEAFLRKNNHDVPSELARLVATQCQLT
jgi:excisionase family DNA binding protein